MAGNDLLVGRANTGEQGSCNHHMIMLLTGCTAQAQHQGDLHLAADLNAMSHQQLGHAYSQQSLVQADGHYHDHPLFCDMNVPSRWQLSHSSTQHAQP